MRLGLYRRTIIPYSKRKTFNKFILYITFVVAVMLSLFFVNKLRPVFLNAFTPYAVNIGSDAINFTVAEYFDKNNYEYFDYVNLSFNNDNEITSVQTNSSLINKVKAELSIALQEAVAKLKSSEILIPFGSVFDNIVLHGIGPDIKVKVAAAEITDLNFNDAFETVGINQVRHKIYIDVYVTISVNCASMSKSEVIHDIIPVAETVIVGDVPQYYAENGDLQILPE